MFASSVVQDTRDMPTFEQAGRYYQELAKRLAAETIETAEAEVETLAREAERVSGFPAQFEDEDLGVQITASSEMAWKHGRDHHVIRVRQSLDPAVKLHMRAHELCHIIMEGEARVWAQIAGSLPTKPAGLWPSRSSRTSLGRFGGHYRRTGRKRWSNGSLRV